uniref:NADH dehydrogenase subunit E n=1 Tax=Bulbophyllum inconspicuum TaxID=1294000 RepID=A0A6G7KYJ3_9ASPA|nr:NADH dehydrogenase subunit E [Bulbophyllum inconspicuum]QII90437.1 NADH dehydrogenase subunit E [Bulbophyllum inconspicuum]
MFILKIYEGFINDVRACNFSKCLFIFYRYLWTDHNTSRSMVRALMCLELILNSVNRNLVTFSDIFDSRQLKG